MVLWHFFICIYMFFANRMVFSMKVLFFFGFRHFGKRFCGLFSCEFISFFESDLFFQRECFFLASGILEDGSVAFFFI